MHVMPAARSLLFAALLGTGLLAGSPALAQAQTTPAGVPVFQSTSSLVFLDVTVLDQKGRIVTTGLSKEDFTITESNQPQRIFSFEAPEAHTGKQPNAGDLSGNAPITIFVLDQLNSNLEDYSFLYDSMQKYLEAEPAHLPAPAELMVVGNRTTELVQGLTTSRDDLLFALRHIRPALPYKLSFGFESERFFQSVQALQQIALQMKGIYTRKNIVWMGYGAPDLQMDYLNGLSVPKFKNYIHQTTNMLVDARITLFVVFPGMNTDRSPAAHDAHVRLNGDDPFGGEINIGIFVNETGGKLFDNNDASHLVKRSQQLGSQYYTLTYQPHDDNATGESKGKFRPIHVSLRDPNLQAITKGGYYARDKDSAADPEQQAVVNVSDAAQATIPFSGLGVRIANIVRHPDSRTAEFTVLVQSKNITWQSAENGSSKANLLLAAVCMSPTMQILASKLEGQGFLITSQDRVDLANQTLRINMVIRLPGDTHHIRVAVETDDGSRVGAADLDRKAIASAPSAPTPEPLTAARPGQNQPRSQH